VKRKKLTIRDFKIGDRVIETVTGDRVQGWVRAVRKETRRIYVEWFDKSGWWVNPSDITHSDAVTRLGNLVK